MTGVLDINDVDRIQGTLAALPQVEIPVTHRFTPGLYTRQVDMPRGSLIVSKIHKTEHPFVVLKGHAAVWTEESGVVQIKAPHYGVTKPNTRRILYIHDDCTWITFHPAEEDSVEEIEDRIIEKRDVPALVDHWVLEQLQNSEVLCLG